MLDIGVAAQIRWTEKELMGEIHRIERQLEDNLVTGEETVCARAYLRQVLKDHRATLRLLRYRSKQAAPKVPERRAPTPKWPTARPVSTFRPLLQV